MSSVKESTVRVHSESFHISAPEKWLHRQNKLAKMEQMFWEVLYGIWTEQRDKEFQVNSLIYFMGNEVEDILNA